VFIVIVVYFVMDLIQKLLDTLSYEYCEVVDIILIFRYFV